MSPTVVVAICLLASAYLLTFWPLLQGSTRIRQIVCFVSLGIVIGLCALSFRVGQFDGQCHVLSQLGRPMRALFDDLNTTATKEGTSGLLQRKLKAASDAWVRYDPEHSRIEVDVTEIQLMK